MVDAFQKHLETLQEIDSVTTAIADFGEAQKQIWKEQSENQMKQIEKISQVHLC